jgi:hypothetical protein
MKTKDLITIGALVGVAYLLYKNSMLQKSEQQSEQQTDETSGGGGGGGGAFPLSYHPILPAISNPVIAPLNVVVPPIKPRINRLEQQLLSSIEPDTKEPKLNHNATQQEETINP